MHEYFILEKIYIHKLKNLISQMLNNEVTFTSKTNKIPYLFEDYNNCKPFLQKVRTKLIISTHTEQSCMNIFNKKHNLDYLFYVLKGYDMTVAKYITHRYYGDNILVNKIIDKIYILLKNYNALLNRLLKCIRLKYIDNYTNKTLYYDLVNNIYSLYI